MRALEIPPTTAPSSPPAIASCVAELSVSSGAAVVVVLVEVVGSADEVTETDCVLVTRAEDEEAEVVVGLTTVFPPPGRLTVSTWLEDEEELEEEELLWTKVTVELGWRSCRSVDCWETNCCLRERRVSRSSWTEEEETWAGAGVMVMEEGREVVENTRVEV